MMTPRINEIFWLIRKVNDSINVVGFLRDHKNGVFVIGGETGSHYSGHSESWEKKWDEYLKQNYITKQLAVEKGLINKDWKSPRISAQDQEIVDKISSNLL